MGWAKKGKLRKNQRKSATLSFLVVRGALLVRCQFLKSRLLFAHVVVPITCGGMIYLLFRAKSLLMFRWADAIGIEPFLDHMRSYCTAISLDDFHWFFYSLPDGLWVYSLTTFMFLVWGRELSRESFFWISIGPLLALGGEIGQAFGVVRGTFDPTDLVLCLIGSFLPLVLLFPENQRILSSRRQLS